MSPRTMTLRACARLFAPAIVFGSWALIALFGVTGPAVRFIGFALAAVAFAVSQIETLRLWNGWRNKRG
jgi:hypothetical protein